MVIQTALVQFQGNYKLSIRHWCNFRAATSTKYGTGAVPEQLQVHKYSIGAVPEQLQAQNRALVQFQGSCKLSIWHWCNARAATSTKYGTGAVPEQL